MPSSKKSRRVSKAHDGILNKRARVSGVKQAAATRLPAAELKRSEDIRSVAAMLTETIFGTDSNAETKREVERILNKHASPKFLSKANEMRFFVNVDDDEKFTVVSALTKKNRLYVGPTKRNTYKKTEDEPNQRRAKLIALARLVISVK